MTTRRTILFGAALVAGAAAATIAVVQMNAAPAPVGDAVQQAAPEAVDPLAYSPCSVAAPPAQPVEDLLAYSPCSVAPPARP
jgi:hypothetical protein